MPHGDAGAPLLAIAPLASMEYVGAGGPTVELYPDPFDATPVPPAAGDEPYGGGSAATPPGGASRW